MSYQPYIRAPVPGCYRPPAWGALDQCALVLEYFFDDFLSAALRKAAEEYGVEYLDLNAEIASLGPDVEFYVDYCHLTLDGNRRVAEILGKAILAARARGQGGQH